MWVKEANNHMTSKEKHTEGMANARLALVPLHNLENPSWKVPLWLVICPETKYTSKEYEVQRVPKTTCNFFSEGPAQMTRTNRSEPYSQVTASFTVTKSSAFLTTYQNHQQKYSVAENSVDLGVGVMYKTKMSIKGKLKNVHNFVRHPKMETCAPTF